MLARMLAQARRSFEALDAAWPEDAFEALQRAGAQERLALNDEPTFGGSAGRLVAVGEGFSLHAGTAVHQNDREALARLCRYGLLLVGHRVPDDEAAVVVHEDGDVEPLMAPPGKPMGRADQPHMQNRLDPARTPQEGESVPQHLRAIGRGMTGARGRPKSSTAGPRPW